MARGGTYMADARDRVRDLLSYVPEASLRSADPAAPLFDWVDYGAQFASMGITDPYAADSDLVSATIPLYTSDPLFVNALLPEIPDLVGFRPFDIHQALVAGAPPDRLMIYRGGFDAMSMPVFWETAGYERRTGTHGDYWTIGEEGEMDLQHPLQSIVFTNMNNVAILDDVTVAFTSTAASLEPVMARAAGVGEAATGDEQLSRLIEAMPADAVNIVALPGEAFLATGIVPENPGMDAFTTVEELLAESDDAVGPMPEMLMSLCGVTVGAARPPAPADEGTPVAQGNADAQAFMLFLTGSEEDAATAAEIAYWRLENMTSPTTGTVYSDLFVPATPVEEAVDGEVLDVRFTNDYVVGGAWRNMILSRDSWPFVWLPMP